MKRLNLIAVACALLFTSFAQATIVDFTFEGNVDTGTLTKEGLPTSLDGLDMVITGSTTSDVDQDAGDDTWGSYFAVTTFEFYDSGTLVASFFTDNLYYYQDCTFDNTSFGCIGLSESASFGAPNSFDLELEDFGSGNLINENPNDGAVAIGSGTPLFSFAYDIPIEFFNDIGDHLSLKLPYDDSVFSYDVVASGAPAPVPAPAGIALLGCGLVLLGLRRRLQTTAV